MILELTMLRLGRDEETDREVTLEQKKVIVSLEGQFFVSQDAKGRTAIEFADGQTVLFHENYNELKTLLGVD